VDAGFGQKKNQLIRYRPSNKPLGSLANLLIQALKTAKGDLFRDRPWISRAAGHLCVLGLDGQGMPVGNAPSVCPGNRESALKVVSNQFK
jgi:hypothetical protein